MQDQTEALKLVQFGKELIHDAYCQKNPNFQKWKIAWRTLNTGGHQSIINLDGLVLS
jgi:hypothetical protein